jgi:hypothetical protein
VITIQLVNLSEVSAWWDRCFPLLSKAMKRRKAESKYPEAWLKSECISGNAQLWITWKGYKIAGVIMTRIQRYPGGEKFLEVFAVAGWKMSLWGSDAYDALEKFARYYECRTITAHGRSGWAKLAQRKAGSENVMIDHVVAIEL